MNQDIMIDAVRREDKLSAIQSKSNPTHIPTNLLDTFTPVFIFRHPILMVNSMYKGMLPVTGMLPTDEDFELMGTLRWTQLLYDYFVSQGKEPTIVEAQDFVYNTKATTDKLCNILGIDPEGVKETWDPLPREHWPDHSTAVAFMGDMMASRGIERRAEEVNSAVSSHVSFGVDANELNSQLSGLSSFNQRRRSGGRNMVRTLPRA